MFGGVVLEAQGAGDFFNGRAFVVAKDEGGAFGVAEHVEGGAEHGGNLIALGETFGGWGGGGDLVEPVEIRIFGGLLFLAAVAGAQEVEGAVDADAVEPGADSGAGGVKGVETFVGAQEGFLHQIFCVLFVAGHKKSETEDGGSMLLDEGTKGELVSQARFGGGFCVGPFHPADLYTPSVSFG